jgi:hypothetical protein
MPAKCHEQTLFAAALIMNYAPRPTTSAKIEGMDHDHFTGYEGRPY